MEYNNGKLEATQITSISTSVYTVGIMQDEGAGTVPMIKESGPGGARGFCNFKVPSTITFAWTRPRGSQAHGQKSF